MIGGHTNVSRSTLDHLQDRMEHTDGGAERAIFALGKATKTIKMPEQLVGAVDEMNDHASPQVPLTDTCSALLLCGRLGPHP